MSVRQGKSHLKWHPSHRFAPNDDVLECDNCGSRSYGASAKKRCAPPRRFHSGAAADCDCTVCVMNKRAV
jgi:hypothetical protein